MTNAVTMLAKRSELLRNLFLLSNPNMTVMTSHANQESYTFSQNSNIIIYISAFIKF